MNIEEYISSGIIDLYATGALPAAEMAEVEQMARRHPEIKAELDLITNTLDRYAEIHAVTPPAHLRNKVLEAVARSKPPLSINTNNKNPEFFAPDQSNVFSINRNTSEASPPLFNWLVAAALALLLLSNALTYYFYRNWKDSEQDLQVALAQQDQYAQNLQQVKQRENQTQQALAFLTDNATQQVALKGVKKTPKAQVNVYWNQPSRRLYVNVEQLPVPPAGKQYQLWALADGKPIDAGMLDLREPNQPLQQMKDVTAAQAFAITLEPQGGSANPTLDEMVVMGQI